MKLVFLIPTYNERENIIPLLSALREVVKQVTKYDISYLVIDDTSPDGTKDVVQGYQRTHPDVFVISGKKEGLGKALLRGAGYAVDTLHADILFQMDADLSHDPSRVPAFLEALDKGADFVIGARYIPGGSIPGNWGLHRKIQSIAGNEIVRFGLGMPYVHDWTGGFRAFSAKNFQMVRDELSPYKGYVFQIAFLHKALLHGAKIAEVPIHFTDRKYGRQKD